MNMKKSAIALGAMTLAGMAMAQETITVNKGEMIYHKTKLTKPQAKKRNKSKLAKQSRKRNRK